MGRTHGNLSHFELMIVYERFLSVLTTNICLNHNCRTVGDFEKSENGKKYNLYNFTNFIFIIFWNFYYDTWHLLAFRDTDIIYLSSIDLYYPLAVQLTAFAPEKNKNCIFSKTYSSIRFV